MLTAVLLVPWMLIAMLPGTQPVAGTIQLSDAINQVAAVHATEGRTGLAAGATTLTLSAPVTGTNFTARGVEEQEQQKLRLEIAKLKSETSTAAAWRSWLPIGTVLVGLMAAGIGVYQYRKDSRRDREIRIQEQYSANIDHLVTQTEADKQSSARVVSALTNLSALVPLTADPASSTRRVTDLIMAEVADDVDFEQLRQVRFDSLCLEHWPDYAERLRKKTGHRDFLMYRYGQALRILAERHARYFETMQFTSSSGFVVQEFIDERDFLLFARLVEGYRLHTDGLDSGQRHTAAEVLGDILGNRDLAATLLAESAATADVLPRPR